MTTYDRYAKFRNNGGISMVPFIPIPVRDTDYYESFYLGNLTNIIIIQTTVGLSCKPIRNMEPMNSVFLTRQG